MKNKIKWLILSAVVVIVSVSAACFGWYAKDNIDKGMPNNSLQHQTYIIDNTGPYCQLYTNLIYKDHNNQEFEISISTKGSDMYVRTLSHSTTNDKEKQFGKWLVSFYGAVKVEDGE